MRRPLTTTIALAAVTVLLGAGAAAALSADSETLGDAVVDSGATHEQSEEESAEPATESAAPPETTVDPPTGLGDEQTDPEAEPTTQATPEPAANAVRFAAAAPELAAADPRPAIDVVLTLVADDVVPDALLVAGFVQTPEVEGVCSVRLTQGDSEVLITGEAEADATTTVCGGLEVPLNTLSPGSWEVVLGYGSQDRMGWSHATTISIP